MSDQKKNPFSPKTSPIKKDSKPLNTNNPFQTRKLSEGSDFGLRKEFFERNKDNSTEDE